MDETPQDPFDALIRDVASPQGPAPTAGQEPPAPANAPAAPAAGQSPQAEGGAKPGAQDPSTAKPATPAPDQGAVSGTENPTDPNAAKPADEAGKGSLPDHLKPFESILTNKKWDVTKPEGLVAALKGYQEAEATLGRRTSEANLLLTRQTDIEKDFRSGIEGVNRRLEAMGLAKIDVPAPENRLKELRTIYAAASVLNNPQATAEQRDQAVETLNQLVYEPMDNLRIKLAASDGKKADATAQVREYRIKSHGLFNERVTADPSLHGAYDAILPEFQPGGVFHSFGLDEFSMTSSPERAQRIEKIGRALQFQEAAYNPDGTVKEGGPIDVEIKKALALANRGGNAAPAGNGQPPAPASNAQNQDPVDAMLNTWAREAAMV